MCQRHESADSEIVKGGRLLCHGHDFGKSSLLACPRWGNCY